jgi:LCP family protein required for cell wall assembly
MARQNKNKYETDGDDFMDWEQTMDKPLPNKKKGRLFRLFIKTFFISLLLFALLFVGGWFTLAYRDGNIFRPPTLPNVNAIPTAAPFASNLDDTAFYTPDHVEEDTRIGEGRLAPEGFTHADRKPLFYTFLLFGLDEGINTDTIMVAAYDGVQKKGYVIGIPRDVKVNVTRSIKKINAAYPAGTRNGGGREGGVEQLKREVMTFIGFSPDFYICVDFKAFIRVVDAVGGIEINVPYKMAYDDPYQNLHIDIPGGMQKLNGKEALHFARYRKGNKSKDTITDYQRIENQQAVIYAVIDKVLQPKNLLRIGEFIDIALENVFTDLTLEEMAWFALEANGLRKTESFSMFTMPTKGNSGPDGGWYEWLDAPAVLELINETINPFIKNIEAGDLDIIN